MRVELKLINNIGFILLAIYLILVGLDTLIGFALPPIIPGIITLASGILILIGR